jgi:hypothetical protein
VEAERLRREAEAAIAEAGGRGCFGCRRRPVAPMPPAYDAAAAEVRAVSWDVGTRHY